jgi:hypothetical protein
MLHVFLQLSVYDILHIETAMHRLLLKKVRVNITELMDIPVTEESNLGRENVILEVKYPNLQRLYVTFLLH